MESTQKPQSENPQVRLPSNPALPEADGLPREKEALRIQAAAVAAQQAALTEEEVRLHQRRVALAQQEQQLATHLEEKRQRLVALRDEAREARAVLQKERAAYEQRVAEILRSQVQARREISASQRQAQEERTRLIKLRRRLKRRWHRQWAGEREAMRRREAAVEQERQRLAKEWERLRQEKARFNATRLRLNGEIELNRRQLQTEREQLLKEQNEMREQARFRDEREAALLQAEQHLVKEKQRWETDRLRLQKEIEGLEARVSNYRRKIHEQEQELARRDSDPRSLDVELIANPSSPHPVSQVSLATANHEVPRDDASISSPAVVPEGQQCDGQIRQQEREGQHRLASLEKLAGELADQRLYLAEQCERLAQTQQHWQQECAEALAELESLGRRLEERERALTIGEGRLRQHADDIAHLRRHLEGWKAQLTQREAAWDGERNRLLADLRTREESVEKRLAALGELRERWEKRRRHQVTRLRSKLATCEELRREWTTLRQEWLRRSDTLAHAQRAVAERALALEQYRQEFIGQAHNPKAAEKRLENLRRHWAARSAASTQALGKQRRDLEAEARRLEEQLQQLHRDRDDLAAREAEWASQQSAWEHEQALVEGEHAKLRHEVQSLHQQREHYEHQLATVQEEVERLARLLLEENDPAPLPVGQAA
jgi:chromosome segregation ATPase